MDEKQFEKLKQLSADAIALKQSLVHIEDLWHVEKLLSVIGTLAYVEKTETVSILAKQIDAAQKHLNPIKEVIKDGDANS